MKDLKLSNNLLLLVAIFVVGILFWPAQIYSQSSDVDLNIRDKPIEIPHWIKEDATKWYEGKSTNSRFSYDLEHMINSKILTVSTIDEFSPRTCRANQLCAVQYDFLKYREKDEKTGEIFTIKYDIGQLTENGLAINTEKITLEAKISDSFLVDLATGLTNIKTVNDECCVLYQYLYKVPLKIGDSISTNSGTITVQSLTSIEYKGTMRKAWIAQDETGNQFDLIDVETGILLSRTIKDSVSGQILKRTDLVDNNILHKNVGIQYKDLHIPQWLKTTIKWWVDGNISDLDFVQSMEFLMDKKIVRI